MNLDSTDKLLDSGNGTIHKDPMHARINLLYAWPGEYEASYMVSSY